MNVLEICSASRLGGGEVHLIQLAQELRRRGHHVEIAGTRPGPIECDHTLPFQRALGLGAVTSLRNILGKSEFDIVHVHVARDYPIAAAGLIGRTSPKLVATRHLLHPIRRNPLYRRIDAWIATTPQIASTLQPLRPGRLAVMPNWVDSSRFAYREHPAGDPIVIGLLGQMSPHKGHDDALGMMERLGAGFRLLVAGEGDASYMASLRQRARGLPVEFLGFVDAVDFLRRLDILILPSWEEPFGIVLLEAMASGVSVVATNAGGPPLILDHGRAGLLVEPRDPGALAAGVATLATDGRLASRLRQSARERVIEVYEVSRVVPRIEAFFESLLAWSQC